MSSLVFIGGTAGPGRRANLQRGVCVAGVTRRGAGGVDTLPQFRVALPDETGVLVQATRTTKAKP